MMVGFKILLISIALMMTTIIQHITSDERLIDREYKSICDDLLGSTPWYLNNKDEKDGFENFKYSFNYLNTEIINEKYKHPGIEETTQNKRTRLLKHQLATDYFLFLYQQRKMSVAETLVPTSFCYYKVMQFFQLAPNAPELFTICLQYTQEALNINSYHGGQGVGPFQCLYETWTKELITYERITGEILPDLENQNELHQLKQFYITLFTIPYYEKIEELAFNINDKERFFSIEKYCHKNGYVTVKLFLEPEV